MNITKKISHMKGILTVQIEGFFTERFINLCKINNIRIWDIRNIVNGVVRFNIDMDDFKKLKPLARKTKCKVEIKNKKGLYFTFFKYRKRKLFLLLILMMILLSITASTFIWKIEITGNNYVSKDEIMKSLENSGIHIGTNKLGIEKKEVINNMRVELADLSWVGLEIDGTKAIVKVVEKTKIEEKNVQQTVPGNIIANKSGIITKIIPENGTALLKEGSYVEEGNILIEGTIYSKVMEPQYVPAKGIIKVKREYTYEKEYFFENIIKEYSQKTKHTIGITIDSKENILNYLNKSLKYDISKNSKALSIFGKNISFDWYTFKEYQENIIVKSKEELLEIAKEEAQNYVVNEVLPNTNVGVIMSEDRNVQDTENGIRVTTRFVINEQIGVFVERENNNGLSD